MSNPGYQRARLSISQKMKPIILERDGHKCVVCGAAEHLELAHIFPVAKGLRGKSARHHPSRNELKQRWNLLNDEHNLITLCKHCHNLYDGRTGHKAEIRYYFDRRYNPDDHRRRGLPPPVRKPWLEQLVEEQEMIREVVYRFYRRTLTSTIPPLHKLSTLEQATIDKLKEIQEASVNNG